MKLENLVTASQNHQVLMKMSLYNDCLSSLPDDKKETLLFYAQSSFVSFSDFAKLVDYYKECLL